MKILIAGATGAIGLPLVRALTTLGHEVVGMTRKGGKINSLKELGAKVVFADAFDPLAVQTVIKTAEPDIVIDQLTWLPANPAEIIKSLPNDTRLKQVGSANLLAASEQLGVKRFISQSRGFFLNSNEGFLGDESAKLRDDAPGEVGKSARATSAQDELVVASSLLDGVVLRYGFFYGPGTWYRPDGAIAEQVRNQESVIIGEGNGIWSFVHIDDAVAATIVSLTEKPGVYNIVDDDPLPVNEWLPAFAKWVDGPAPGCMTEEEALKSYGEEAVFYHRTLTGASNQKAKSVLGFKPRPLLWKMADSF
jgi:nucleoside-diphosphate-sugar epimerase